MYWNDLVFYQGNEELQRFIELALIAAASETPIHFHVEGVRGTGKTTLIRAARSRLPIIERVQGCPYNCGLDTPHCPEHLDKNSLLESEFIPMPFLEISHSAKVGTVVGSIDLGRLTSPDNPQAAILPGTLARAHRGVVFVDEVNRLADTSPALVDVLLDAMGTKPGRLQIEETGLPMVEIPLGVSIWAASNPDEEPGPLQEIRRQLADRFDFVVHIDRPERSEIVKAIINARRSICQQVNSVGINEIARNLPFVRLNERVEEFLAELYIRFNLESIRGVQAAKHGTLLHAAWQKKEIADFADLAAVLPAALRHRLEQGKLIEVVNTLENKIMQENKNNDKHPPISMKKDLKETNLSGSPTIWNGFWQLLSKQMSNNAERPIDIENPPQTNEASTNSSSSEKKKIEIMMMGQEEDGDLQN